MSVKPDVQELFRIFIRLFFFFLHSQCIIPQCNVLCLCLSWERREEWEQNGSQLVCVCILNKETEGKGRPPIFLFFFSENRPPLKILI